MKTNWQTKKLDDVCELITRGVSPRYTGQHGIPVLNQKCIRDHRINYQLARLHDDQNKFVNEIKSIKGGDVLINSTGVGTLGRVAQVIATPLIKTTIDSHVSIVRSKKDIFCHDFFAWLLINKEDEIAQKGEGCGGQIELSRETLKNIFVTYPESLTYQHRIVKILDEVFEKIAKAKKNAEKNLRNAKELFEAYLNSVFANPGKDWEYCFLNDHVKFIDYRGKTPKKTTSGVRLITAKNIKMGYLQKEPEEFIDIKDYAGWMTRGIPKKGDILFTTEAPLANVAQLDTDEKVAFAQRTIIFQSDHNKLDSIFLKYLLLSAPIQKKIIEKGTGATVKGIKASLLKQIPIYFPSLNHQHHIVTHLDALSTQTRKLEAIYKQKLTSLEELKKSVLKKAFSGEL